MSVVQVSEYWRELEDYPGYAVSNLGRVINTRTDLVKHPARNQQGIVMVNLVVDGEQHVRSVALLVATAFVPHDYIETLFDTPIHLDGNKENCRADNLMWRPRWFAVKYHKQFSEWERKNRYGFKKPVRLVDTGEVFPTSWEAATKYGLLDHDIFIQTLNGNTVFPCNYRFEVIKD